MRKLVFVLMLMFLMPFFSACNDDDALKDDEVRIMHIKWNGKFYTVPCANDPHSKHGRLIFLDEEFRHIWLTEIAPHDDHLVTYGISKDSIGFYVSLEDLMNDLNLHFIN